MGPELIDPQRFDLKDSRPTNSSDCYALGMVVYETMSGHLPFHHHTDLTVFVKVLAGEHPTRGAGFGESLWEMLTRCWTPWPNKRPSIQDVLQCLDRTSNLPESPGVIEGDYSEWDSADDSSGMISPFTSLQCLVVSTPSIASP